MSWQANWCGAFLSWAAWLKLCKNKIQFNTFNFVTAKKLKVEVKNPRKHLKMASLKNAYLCVHNIV
jgi:hypothetical protein